MIYMNYKNIFEYVDTHKEEFSDDELLSISFLCSAIVQDRDYERNGIE